MTEYITIVGNIAGDPERRALPSGEPIARFRVAATTQKRGDDGVWVDAHTSWYTVSAFRRLGEHALASLRRGQRVIVTGRFRVRTWDNPNGTRGTEAEIDADAVGHDLLFGTTSFQRDERNRATTRPAPESAPDEVWATPGGSPDAPRPDADGGADGGADGAHDAPHPERDLVGATTWDTRSPGDATPF